MLSKIKKNWQIIGLLVLIFALLFSLKSDNMGVLIGKNHFSLERATTNEEKTIGLSGRESLTTNSGMIFVNQKDEKTCMWMKDMQFDIAIIWVRSDGKVEHIESRLRPESYPETFCHNAKYVIEINPEDFGSSGLKAGDQIKL